MSELDDKASKEQASSAQTQELLRNVHHRIGADGSVDFNALQYLQGLAASIGATVIDIPMLTAVVTNATVDLLPVVHGYPNMQIIVFDILLSINAPTIIDLTDAAGNDLLATMYAPNAGQGYTMNSNRGKHLPWDRGLYVQSTNAVQYSIDVSYGRIER